MPTNEQRLHGVYDAIFVGGGSMVGGNSLQYQILEARNAAAAALAAPLIVGWPGPNGTTYSTSVLQQLVFITRDVQTVIRQNTELKTQLDRVETKLAALAVPATTISIDDTAAAKIASALPKYRLTPEGVV